MGETERCETLVHLPAEGVMFIGGLKQRNLGSPVMPEGYADGFIDAVELVEALNPAVIVPGHGQSRDSTCGKPARP